jgi:CubicO group peptidase (beta-lactamase class C family)
VGQLCSLRYNTEDEVAVPSGPTFSMGGDESMYTRRQLLTRFALGLGMSQCRLLSAAAAQQDAPTEGKMLEPGEPAAVGMSARKLQRISDRLQIETEREGLTAASILVARDHQVVFHRGFGKLNSHPNAPSTQPDTIYLLASISKPVTVCGLMLLVERGDVVLSDRVQAYLPEFQGENKEKVRVSHLLSHTSGMPDMLPENIELRRANAPLSVFVERALRTPLLYEPGSQFAYQSMGTLLAGEITERITGMRLRDFLHQEVFEPLGMFSSVLGLEDLKISNTAIFQQNRDDNDARSFGANSQYWRDMGHPWGGIHSTTGDLAALLQTFLNGGAYGSFRLFSPTTTAAMTRDHNGAIKAPWGLGWALRDSLVWNHFGDLASPRTFGHVGATGTVAWADPARQLICVLLTTRGVSYRGGSLLKRISNMVQASVDVSRERGD